MKTKRMKQRGQPPSPWIGAGALLLLTALVYLPALQGDFIWDDDNHVTENPTLTSWAGLRDIWLGLRENATCQYYPLTFTAFWVQYRFWGLHPLPYHLVNILLHGLNAVLLWRLLRRWGAPGAWAAAALFAVHPIHVMSVAWITELKNVLCGGLMLLTLLLWTEWDERGGRRLYAAALLAFAAAMLSKTAAAALPALMGLVAWWRKGRVSRRDAAALLPFLGLGLALGAVTIWVEQRLVWGQGPGPDLSPVQRVLLAGRSFWFYAGKILWPAGLNFIYPKWGLDPRRAVEYLAPLALVALWAALWAGRRRWGRAPLAVAVYFFLAAPALVLLHVLYMMRYTLVSDHWIYFGSPALIALAAAGAARATKEWRQESAGLLALVLLLLGALTWSHGARYRDQETLWRVTLDRHPGAWLAANNLGILVAGRGDHDEARLLFQRARDLEPAFVETRINLGNLEDAQRGPEAALPWFQEALDMDPRHPMAHFNMGFALERLGRREEAIAHYRRVIEERPNTGVAHYNLANSLSRLGRLEEAEPHYRAAIELDPVDGNALANLGSVLTRMGRHAEAVETLHRAAALRPNDGLIMYNLGRSLLRLRRIDEAMAALLTAARARPDLPDAPHQLAVAWNERKNRAQAESFLREALRRDPGYRPALNDLAWMLATAPDEPARRRREAIELAEQLCTPADRVAPDELDTLAAALASAGRFTEAAETIRRAMSLAENSSDTELTGNLKSRFLMYENKQPYVQP